MNKGYKMIRYNLVKLFLKNIKNKIYLYLYLVLLNILKQKRIKHRNINKIDLIIFSKFINLYKKLAKKKIINENSELISSLNKFFYPKNFIILSSSLLILSNLNGNEVLASVNIAPDVSKLNLFPI